MLRPFAPIFHQCYNRLKSVLWRHPHENQTALTPLCSAPAGGSAPAASALDGEALRSANTLAALNLRTAPEPPWTTIKTPLPPGPTQCFCWCVLPEREKAAKAAGGSTVFRDVPTSYAPYVAYAVRQGWVCGVSAVEFAPSRAITANAWCAMLLRMLGYRESAGDFTVPDAAAFAQHIGLVSRRYDGALTRGDVFEMMREALTFPYQNGSGTVIERLVESGTCTYATASALGLLDAELTVREAADRCTAAVFCLDLLKSSSRLTAKSPRPMPAAF